MFDHLFFTDSVSMIRFLSDHLQETIALSLDHDLDGSYDAEGRFIDAGTGRDMANYLAKRAPVCPVLIHTSNSLAAIGMEMELRDAKWQTRRVLPFDDLAWIGRDWFPELRRLLVGPIDQPSAVVAQASSKSMLSQ